MKTLGSGLGFGLSVVAATAASGAWAAIDANSTGYESQSTYVDPYVSVQPDPSRVDSMPAVATESTTDTDTEKLAAAEQEKARKACEEAKAKQEERDSAATQKAVDEKCNPIDVAAKEPVSGMTQTASADGATVQAIGSDRSTGMYYPPENYKIKGKNISWGLVESYKQQMKDAGYDDNATAAVAGNLMHESNMFVSNKWVYDKETGKHVLTTTNGALSRGDKQNGVYTSFGIAQYHDTSTGVGRATDMLNYVDGKNLSPNGLQGTHNKQIEYLIADLPKQLKGSYAAFTDPNVSLEAKTGIIVDKYEIPKKVAGEVYGRMGGADRLSSARSILVAMNSPVTYDTDSTNSTKTGGKPISNPNGSGTGALVAATSQNSGLGVNLTQLAGLGGLTTLTGGNNINFSSGNIVSALLANAILQSGLNLNPAAGPTSSGGKSNVTSTVTEETVVESIQPRGYDVVKAIADLCADDLDVSEDAKMLKVKMCRTEAAS
ncbi:MAG: hypothetical protein DI585_01235 [Pseudomonas fluorescens]|nr:MAG: hypothetical protein DI585_01235 [Pseudomonas fluorescens]